jgi:hypothetical protein
MPPPDSWRSWGAILSGPPRHLASDLSARGATSDRPDIHPEVVVAEASTWMTSSARLVEA